jgi:hypothetical protein
MNTTIEEFDISETLKKLNLELPIGLAFIPENIEKVGAVSDFIFPEPLTQINKVFRINNIDVAILGDNASNLRSRKSADLYLPSIYIGISLLTQNSAVVSVALSVLANYVTDFFKGSFSSKTVSLDIYVETKGNKKVKKINYKGSADGLKNLEDLIKKL